MRMSFFISKPPHVDPTPLNHAGLLNRRQFLGQMGTGLGSIALACLLAEESGAATNTSQLARGALVFPAKAKRIVQIFCPGAVSQLDTFDYKPELIRMHGQ